MYVRFLLYLEALIHMRRQVKGIQLFFLLLQQSLKI